jgi:hypothetical protein
LGKLEGGACLCYPVAETHGSLELFFRRRGQRFQVWWFRAREDRMVGMAGYQDHTFGMRVRPGRHCAVVLSAENDIGRGRGVREAAGALKGRPEDTDSPPSSWSSGHSRAACASPGREACCPIIARPVSPYAPLRRKDTMRSLTPTRPAQTLSGDEDTSLRAVLGRWTRRVGRRRPAERRGAMNPDQHARAHALLKRGA